MRENGAIVGPCCTMSRQFRQRRMATTSSASARRALRKSFSVRWLKGKFYTLKPISGARARDTFPMATKMQPLTVYFRMTIRGCHFMLSSVIDSFFGCSHRRTTFPITPKRPARQGAYVSCLDCGKEFAYNWSEMRMEEKSVVAVPVAPPVHSPITRPAQALSRLLRLGS